MFIFSINYLSITWRGIAEFDTIYTPRNPEEFCNYLIYQVNNNHGFGNLLACTLQNIG